CQQESNWSHFSF
nr:immunoglobulin light chain junction region [Macaca mulatta]